MEKGVAPNKLAKYWVLAILVVLFAFFFLFNAKAEVPITGGLPCGSVCHSIPQNYENFHDTRYDSLKWPDLNPDCQQCHQATSTVTLNPNIAQFHVFKQTTTYSPPSYPSGMGCDSCHHNYKGVKLDKIVIAAAISSNNTDCGACHGSAVVEGHEKFHDTTYIDNPPVDCSSCHEMASPTTGNPNLWKWHLDRPTTSYPGGMDCQSCHDYTGLKLEKTNIESAITNGNTKCDACHTIHEIDPNIKHRTSFLGNSADCNVCHTPSRTPKDTTDNLQDLHVDKQTTTYPGGMTCDGCHKYSGVKLSKGDIDIAISSGDTACNACHTSVVSVGHEPVHNTQYDSSKWPNLSPDCRSCHEMVSANTGQPNLWKWHLDRVTTSYPGGMDCQSCHSYSGDKLSKSDIDNAIDIGNTDCSACHGSGVVGGHEAFHDTTYIDNPPVDCSSCHEMTSSTTGNPNLWKWHLDRPTTSYPGGMDCQSCHNYSGQKLSKSSIEMAISSGDKRCNACHESKIHEFDPNTDHRTSFMGDPSKCTTCHTPSRSPAKDTADSLQDLHIGKATTSYPSGMTCDSCHKYNGSSLNPADIANAIAQGGYTGTSNTKCNACHTKISENGHEAQHETPFDSSISYGESLCSKCHITDASKPAPFTLWDVHINKESTNYTAMNCDTCHKYAGSKLIKSDIDNAIAAGNKNCSACHTIIGEHAKNNYNSLGSSVHAGKDCLECHQRASEIVAKPPLPDSTLLTIPGSNVCFTCHDATGGASDVLASFLKTYRHETPECSKCHNPHVEDKSSAQAPAADGALKGTKGVAVDNGAAGTSPTFTLINSVNNQYELCFLCHSNNNLNIYGTIPVGTQDKAVEFNTNNPSFHPVEGTGKNLGIKEIAFVQGTPWNPTSDIDGDYSSASEKMYCTDCHGSDNSDEPKGPHGSIYPSILKKKFTLKGYWKDDTGNASVDMALCFGCHEYNVYYNGTTGSRFPRHQYHVSGKRVACYDCHEPHGTSSTVHLIRLQPDLVDKKTPGVKSFVHSDSGGSCTPSCHGTKSYSHNYPHVVSVTPPPPGTGGIVWADQALSLNKLKNLTDDDYNTKDVTLMMKDSSFDKSVAIENESGEYKELALKANEDVSNYQKVLLRVYITKIDDSPDNGRVYAYNSSGTSLDTSSYLSYSVNSRGWNEIDVTTLAKGMSGFGWMKFRLMSIDKRHEVSEAEFSLTEK